MLTFAFLILTSADGSRSCNTDGFVQCPNYYFIPLEFLRDGIPQCPYGEDEQTDLRDLRDPPRWCPSSMTPDVLTPSMMMDGKQDCPLAEDELVEPMKVNSNFVCRKVPDILLDCSCKFRVNRNFTFTLFILNFNRLMSQTTL